MIPSKKNKISSSSVGRAFGLQTKALFAPAVLILMMAIAFVTVFLSSERQSRSLTRTFETAMVKNALVARIRTQTVNIHSEMYRIMSLVDAGIDTGQLEQIGKKIAEDLASTKIVLINLDGELRFSPDEKTQLANVVDALLTYERSSHDAIEVTSSGRSIQIIYMVGVEQNFSRLQAALEKLDKMVSVVQYGDILEETRNVQALVIIFLAIAAILGVVLTIITMRQVARPIVAITKSMRLLASGNTDVGISGLDRGDEIGEMARALAVFKVNAIALEEANLHLHDELIARNRAELAMQKALDELAYFAQYDQLTGIYNRRMFATLLDESLVQAKCKNSEVALHFIDLDHFKEINDTFGHDSGDEALIEAVARINATVREVDIVARLGGDEFGVIQQIEQDSHISAGATAQRIIDAFVPKLELRNQAVHIGCSIGIASYPSHGGNSKSLIKAADTAMYYAKDSGRNQYCLFKDGLQRQFDRQIAIAAGLRDAIANNELYMVYQPQIDAQSRVLVGFEALMRWESKKLETIGPAQFFPIAENIGIGSQLDEWGLNKAVKQAVQWNSLSTTAISVSVNISVQQLNSPGFVDFVSEQLSDSGLKPNLLVLEITETVLMSNPDECIAHIDQLRELGIRVSIDDFGTGHSSLSYLSILSVEYLKVDRIFIVDIDKNISNQKIVCSIIGLAKSLGFDVVAEGVETQQELAYLLSVDCNLIQGYYFSKPLSCTMAMHYVERLTEGLSSRKYI